MNTRLFQKDFITPPDWTVEDLNTMIDLAFKLKYKQAENRLHIQKALMALTMTARA